MGNNRRLVELKQRMDMGIDFEGVKIRENKIRIMPVENKDICAVP